MYFFVFPVPVCAITASGVPRGTIVSINRFSTLCGWLAQRQGWRVKGWIWPSEQARSAKANSWPDCQMGDRNDNFIYSSLWYFKGSFTCHKILRHGTFPLYFPSERKVFCKVFCGFLSPLKIHRLSLVLNPQPLGPVASTLTSTPPRRQPTYLLKFLIISLISKHACKQQHQCIVNQRTQLSPRILRAALPYKLTVNSELFPSCITTRCSIP
jgi:hypothetical protein